MIPKPGKDRTQPLSYRPISLLSCIPKLFEKLLIIRIQAHLETRNIFPSHKFGFRQNHETIEQVNRITTEIRTILLPLHAEKAHLTVNSITLLTIFYIVLILILGLHLDSQRQHIKYAYNLAASAAMRLINDCLTCYNERI